MFYNVHKMHNIIIILVYLLGFFSPRQLYMTFFTGFKNVLSCNNSEDMYNVLVVHVILGKFAKVNIT